MPIAVSRKRKQTDTQEFLFGYTRCNPQQKEAVDRIEGPVMVLAGPGTGKTEVLALRVANILKKTHMRPSNILCLTFSMSGADAMRERIRLLIGADAYGITVNTVHGFCNDVIASHPDIFDCVAAMEHISDVERVREMNKIIDQKISHIKLLSQKYPYLKTGDILARISQLKREGVTQKENVLRIADAAHDRAGSVSKPGSKSRDRALSQAKKFGDFLELFFAYQEMLDASGRYDYEDMILTVIRAFHIEDWMLQSYQERYQYILVDEFQDLNGSQYEVIQLLTSYGTLGLEPNLFTVGDDDQAIYRFQGANLANILKFRERFPDAPTIVLGTSYRCRQKILDAADSLISKNRERLVGKVDGLTKGLKSAQKTHGSLRLVFSQTDTEEPFFVADLVEERIRAGAEPKKIAILTRTNRELAFYEEALREREIPVSMRGKRDLLAHPLVNQVIAVLKAVQNPQDSSVLAGALGCACFAIHPADLGRLYVWRREQKCSLFDCLLKLDTPGEHGVSPYYHDNTTVIYARDILLDLHNKLSSRTVVETLECLLKECGFIPSVIVRDRLGRPRRAGPPPYDTPFDPLDFVPLQEFFNRVKMRAYEQKNFSFESFLSDLKYYQDGAYPDLRLSYEITILSETGVRLLTAHQSKGLEFDTVILPHFREGHWDSRRHHPSIAVPEDLLFGWEKERSTFEQSQDERRVAYVAITRAKNEVIFTCPKELSWGAKVKPVSPSGFIAECGGVEECSETLLSAGHPSRSGLRELRYNIDSEFASFLKSRLEHFSLSVTALNHFLEDPKIFLEIDLLQVPRAKESSLAYGNAVHWALRAWGLSTRRGEPFNQQAFVDAFVRYLGEREILTQKERQRLRTLGEESLPRYFDTRLRSSNAHIYAVEQSLTARFGKIPLKGKIDRIDLECPTGARAIITDYKTGRPRTPKEIREGDYFRQLVFYALLFKHSRSLLEPRSFVLDFVGEGNEAAIERGFEVASSDQKELEEIVTAVWKKIIVLDFSPL